MFDAIVKVGGSLCNEAILRSCAPRWAALAQEYRLLLFPGGGPFADQVRAVDVRFGLSDSAAHWMAILAMDQYAYVLADVIPNARLVRDMENAATASACGQVAVLAPSALLLRADPLPHSWAVTSDALAAWLASYTGVRLLVLLKAVAGVYRHVGDNSCLLAGEVSRHELERSQIVDPYFVHALPAHVDCWIVDGRCPERLAQLLRSGRTVGTRVLPSAPDTV